MTQAVQLRKGTTSEHASFTGLQAEATVDTTKKTIVVHDGSTAGGVPLSREDLSNSNPTNLSAINGADTAAGDLFVVYDVSASAFKKITRAELNNAIEQDALASVAITGGTINNTAIGGSTAAAGSFTTLTTSSTVTLNGGTANGVLYLNGSKVATSGSALTFDGTNLGVGTSSPQGKVHSQVATPSSGGISSIYYGGDGSRQFQLLQTGSAYNTAGAGANELWYYTASYAALTFGSDGNIPIKWVSNNSEQMRLTSTGLGIGTSSPAAILATSKSSSTQATGLLLRNPDGTNGSSISIDFEASSGTSGAEASLAGRIAGVRVGSGTTGALDFFTNNAGTLGSAKMRLDSSGNLGLGVTPSAWDANFTAIQLKNGSALWNPYNGGGTALSANTYYGGGAYRYIETGSASVLYNQLGGQHQFYTAPSGTAGNAITFTQALTLDASGNLLLGGTSAGASSAASFAIFNGTAPTGSVTNGIILYAEDVSSSSELKVRDEAGNVTTLSPHNFSLIPEGPSEEMAWAYYSEKGGKRINVDMLKLARMVEKLTGEKLVYEL